MKNIYLLIFFSSFGIMAMCQEPKRDSVSKAVDEYVKTVNIAADKFLNTQLSTGQRLNAISPYSYIYDESQIERFKKVVQSQEEKPEIRAMALNKIYQAVGNDEKFQNLVIRWFESPSTPQPLRDETLNFVETFSFSTLRSPLDSYQKMTDDPDPDFRAFAVSKLILSGDERTQQMLIKGLENPSAARFEPSFAIELLSLSPKKEFYPAVYKVLLETRDEAVRLSALQVLGPYKPAREKLIAISLDPNEKEPYRESALLALYSGDKENIVKYVMPLLQDKSASGRLQAIGIQIMISTRESMAYRRSKKAKKADDLDRLIRSIKEGKGTNNSAEVTSIAEKYLLLVRPNF